MDVRHAELTKYAANAMLATKISFMNELSNMAERVGVDIERFAWPSAPIRGSATSSSTPAAATAAVVFPKDVRSLERVAAGVGYDAQLLRAVEGVNDRQKQVPVPKSGAFRGPSLRGRRSLWGLSFKPNTDDMREAPSLNPDGSALAGRRHGAGLRPGRHG